MSRYIDLDVYHSVEKTHPFYVEMMDEIMRVIDHLSKAGSAVRILEIGAGTGLSTKELMRVKGCEIDAVEIDPQCHERLALHIGDRVQCICADAIDYWDDKEYDVAVSVFSHDHIPPEKAEQFVKNLHRNIMPGGHYIMGGEIIPFYESDVQRQAALYNYHSFIVDQALRAGNFEVAKLEIDALQSGLNEIGDFKRHESIFEQEMLSNKQFELLKKEKIGPLDMENVGGVFVYVFKAV